MKRASTTVLSWVALLALGACGVDVPQDPEPSARWNDPASRINGRPTFLAFRVERVDSALVGCDPAADPYCTHISLGLLTFPDAPGDLQDVLHGHVVDLMGLEVREGTPALTPWIVEEAAALYAHKFLEKNRAFRVEFPDAAGNRWYLNRELTVVAASPAFLALSMAEDTYTGGAHGNSRMQYRVVDAASGGRLGLADLLKPGFEDPLRAAGQGAFRVARGYEPEADFQVDGFFVGAGGFFLNENFAPTRDGLAFHYDPYEINAYAAGPTDFVIPWGEIREWVRPDGPLASFLR